MGLVTGSDQPITHGQGKLADPAQHDEQDHAGVGITNGGPGKGSESNILGTGASGSGGNIQHVPPGKGSGTSIGLDGAKAKGLAHPMGAADTKP